MAALVLAAAGSAIGAAAISGTVLGLSGATIGYVAGSLLASALIKPPNQQGPRLADLRVGGTEYGAPIPWVAGGPRISGQIAWASNRREIANTQKVGKGGGGKVTNFTYEVDLLILLTENEIEGVSRIWSNGELVYSGLAKEGLWGSLTVYTGAPDQLPDPTYEAAVGAGNAPAYRGRGYVVITGLQLGGGGQIPNLTFETLAGATQASSIQFLGAADVAGGNSGATLPPHQAGDLIVSISRIVNASANATPPIIDASWTTPPGGVSQGSPTGDPYGYRVQWKHDANNSFNGFVGATNEVVMMLVYRNAVVAENIQISSGSSISKIINPSIASTSPLGGWMVTAGFSSASSPPIAWSGTGIQRIRKRNELGGGTMIVFDSGARVPLSPGGEYQSAVNSAMTAIAFEILPTQQNTSFIGNYPTLKAVVEDLCTRSGYAPEDFDTAALAAITRPVRGMALGQVSSTRGALETLQTGYFFDVSKSDKIRFAPRATVPVVDIPFTDLGTANDPNGSEDPLGLIVGNELEVPAQVSLSYHNTAGDYNVATEHSDRLLSGQQTNQVVQLGLGLLPAEAKGVADGLLVDQIASLTRTTLRLPLKYAYLEPGDVFTVTNADGRQYRLRSQAKRDTLTILEHECVIDDAGALTSAQITSSNYALSETVRQIAPTIWEAMDIPLLRDADNSAGFYVAMAPNRAGPTDEWPGGVFLRSWGADAYDELFSTGDPCALGSTVGALGSFDSSGRFDERNTVTVRVTGQLANTTRADMLDSLAVNAALIGNEIVRFRLAELLGTVDGENEYRLSGFLRGQRGTEQHMSTHVAGERFVLLSNSLRRVTNQTSEIGVASQIKAVTFNSLLSGVTPRGFTDTGVSLRPFSVAGLRCLPSGADLVLTWHRRTRLSYRYGGTVGASVPLGEASESYRIEVFAGAVLRNTYTSADSTFTYASFMQAGDGFSAGSSITFTVRQISAVVGAGFPATLVQTAPSASAGVAEGGVVSPGATNLDIYPFGQAASTALAVQSARYGAITAYRIFESADSGQTYTQLTSAGAELTSWPNFRAVRADGVYVSVRGESVQDLSVNSVNLLRGAAGAAPAATTLSFARSAMPVAVATNGTKFFVISEGNTMRTSLDGVSWSVSGSLSGLPFVFSSTATPGTMGNPLGDWASNYQSVSLLLVGSRWFLSFARLLYYTDDPEALAGWTLCTMPANTTAPALYAMASLGGNLFARGSFLPPGGGLQNTVVLRSTDNGATWTTVFSAVPGAASDVFVMGSSLVLISYDWEARTTVSTDGGVTWAAVPNGQQFVGRVYPVKMGSNLVIASRRAAPVANLPAFELRYSTDGITFTNSAFS